MRGVLKALVAVEVQAPGADATESNAQTCTVCGYVIKDALGHTHNYNTMKNDESNHWNECVCGDKSGVAVHTWDNGIVTKEATYDEEGKKTYTCSVCSYTKIESIDKLIWEDDTNNGTDTNIDAETDINADTDTTEQPSGGCRSSIGIGTASVVIVVMAIGTCTAFVAKKKED